MIQARLVLLLSAGLAAPAAASDPIPATTNLTITPSITCPEGARAEFIRLSRAQGDAIDAVFALCRDQSLSRNAWIERLNALRKRLVAARPDQAGKDAIDAAFTERIADELTEAAEELVQEPAREE